MSMHHTELSGMLETAVVAARLAGQRAMEELRYIKKDIKNGNELVTQADPICQKLIMDRIRESFPDHGFFAEEGSQGSFLRIRPRSEDPIWWVIDPIDGTNNFANGLLCFSVSIAAMAEGTPIVGVIFDPATDSMYTAAQDMDAQLNNSRITVSDEDIGPFSSFAIDSHFAPGTHRGTEIMMEKTRFRSLGSTALHLAYVAKGGLIGMCTSSGKLWDIAAGALLVERAGGTVTNLEGRSPFPVNIDACNADPVPLLAASKKVYKQVHGFFAEK